MSDLYEREQVFHDEWAASIDPAQVKVVESMTGSTSPEARWILTELGDLRGKCILELGSGAGEGAVYFALRGGDVTATDLSQGMLGVVEAVAEFQGTKVRTQVCSADDLSQFPDATFDIVYAANLLHHVNVSQCLDEVKRVLKPHGMAAFWDPVAYNPVINVYRRMASEVRSVDEHPLRRDDLRQMRLRFQNVKTRFFWLTALLIFVKFYLIDRVHPNSDRYWKRIISHEKQIRPFYLPLAAFDRLILMCLPFLGWWCWNVAIVARMDGETK